MRALLIMSLALLASCAGPRDRKYKEQYQLDAHVGRTIVSTWYNGHEIHIVTKGQDSLCDTIKITSYKYNMEIKK